MKKLLYVFLASAVFFFHFGIFYGLDFSDSFYHLNQAINPVGGNYLYPFLLSSMILNKIVEIVGQEVIYLRLINSTFLFLSFLLPFFLVGNLKISRRKGFIFICCLILFAPFNVNILGYDTLSILILSLIFSISVLYISYQRWYIVIALALLCSMAILIRLPNLLVIPILCLFLFFVNRKTLRTSTRLLVSTTFGVVTLLAVLLSLYSYYGDSNSFQKASANTNSHFLSELVANYIRDGISVFFYTAFILLVYYLFTVLGKRTSKVIALFAVIVIFLIFIGIFITPSKYSIDYAFFILAVALAFTAISLYHNWNSSKDRLVLILYLLFLFINPFGSNTGLLKGYSLFVLFPFVYGFVRYKSGKFWTTILFLLVPLAIITKIYGIYEDKNIFFLNTIPNHELLSPIRTNKDRADYLNYIDRRIVDYRQKGYNVLVYGDKSHIFHYLYPETSVGVASFFQPVEDITFLPQILDSVSSGQKSVIFLVPSYPEKNRAEMVSLLERELLKKGFVREPNNSAIILQDTRREAKNIE